MKIVILPVLQRFTAGLLADVTLVEAGNWILHANIWYWLGGGGAILALATWLSVRYIPHTRVGVVEKLWAKQGSVGEGCIIALQGEAGYQAELLRGGLHFGYWRWQYRVHQARLVAIPQGEMGYVYARDGESLSPSQTLGRCVPSNNFQNARAFLSPTAGQPLGQRGRQRAILREGVYAINPALFVVITRNNVFALRPIQEPQEIVAVAHWQKELQLIDGFQPLVVGGQMSATKTSPLDETAQVDSIAIVTVQDGLSLPPGRSEERRVGKECCR